MHRRQGIGTKLVQRVEWWSQQKGAEYAYMATDRSNAPSLNLFTSSHLGYTPFRSPAILTRPVHSHPLPLPPPSSTALLHLPPSLSSPLYRHLFSSPSSRSEFFPSDFDSLLSHPLTLATFLAFPATSSRPQWDPLHLPSSFALMSLWNTKDIFHLRVRGASALLKAVVRCMRALDRMCPWLHVPSVRDVFKPFGVYVMYGLYMQGERGEEMMNCLCRLAHNIAMGDKEVAAVVAEVGGRDHVRAAVPHWRRFSCEEDVWCMKRLGGNEDDVDDWSRSKATTDVMFVDPREF